jgi:DNA-binding NarL/FixJ family response regulator
MELYGPHHVSTQASLSKMTHFVIADDHPLYLSAVCEQIARAFSGAEVTSFTNYEDVLSFLQAQKQKVDVVLLDFSMPGMNGQSGVRKLVSVAGDVPVAILSGVANVQDVNECISVGARGFLTKTMDNRVLTNALSIVLYGGTYVPIEFVSSGKGADRLTAPQQKANEAPQLDLSERDVALLRMLSDGESNKEIARALDLQEVTVKFYLSRLFRTLEVKNRAQAAVKAMQLGIVQNPNNG